ncbi:hypothetical protein ACOI22_10820 [Glaciecola sp. 2405UD65-10]|uniref:hypothetical protein n=1 Tax=Glaciecola sp. 2405UD65-10 TaxID=3397244 RepID=UPI003B5C543C
MKRLGLINFGLAIVVFLNMFLFTEMSRASETSVKTIGWGGGGAFTSTAVHNDNIYLSSDVAGVWKQEQGQWTPFVEGLGNYNVTSLAAFNNQLFAITTTALYVSDGTGSWEPANIALSTYRSTTDQPYAISANGSLMCIANRNQKIDCIDTSNQHTTYITPETNIKGVYFNKQSNNELYFFSGSQLYKLDLTTHNSELVQSFSDSVVSIADYGSQSLVATKKQVFDMSDLSQSLLETGSKNIVNFFVAEDTGNEVVFISTGSTWGNYPARYAFVENELVKEQSAKREFDTTLPHRPYQRYLNKFLGISNLNGTTWITDYWGVYQLNVYNDDGVSELREVTNNAVNIVATDLAITNNNIYISAMDNGVVKMAKEVTNDEPQFEGVSFSSLQGHAWTLLQDGDTVHGIISPWSNANDFLFSYNEVSAETTTSVLTNYDSRPSSGAFWGNAYSRQLVNFNGITSYRDGVDGGLVSTNSALMNPSEPVIIGERNKVFRSVVEHNGLLYVANCEGSSVMMALDEAGEVVLTESLPNGFCPFTAYSYEDELYFLGTKGGKSEIYEYTNNAFSLLISEAVGSVFYQMAVNPQNENQIVAATNSWSYQNNSGLFVSIDNGQTFFDKSCVLSHKNGVVGIKFDNDTAYILQKVGGLRAVPSALLFAEGECTLTVEEPAVEAIDFNTISMRGYGYGQDKTGTISIEDDGATLKMTGNRWRAARLEYTVTPNTVIEFEFKSSAIGEIHGIGFDKDPSISRYSTFSVFGTQLWGRLDYRYDGSGEYQQFSIPVGQFYTGDKKYLFFVMDHDVSRPSGESYFKNVRIFERD